MEINKIFENISNELKLGTLITQPKRVSGGLMHKMYCLETTTGKYAVKLLNPSIMKRPDAFKNYQIAEHFEKILQENKIPILPALEFDKKKMQCINNQYFYLFNWMDGKTLSSEEIDTKHCKLIGSILAKIHKIDQKKEPFDASGIHINWDSYIELANEKKSEIAVLLKNNRELLYLSQEQGNAALKNVPELTCICDGDMDSKNVLWVNEKPIIIDLECLNYGNPHMELFQLALSWSGYEDCNINYELLKSFIKAYIQEYGELQIDWEVLYSTNYGRLEWLEYNIKRTLWIECESEEERKLGIEQVNETIKHVVYYHLVKDELLEQLNSMR